MGVVVRDTTSEIRMATDRVTANSRNRRPTMPPISRMGNEDRHQGDAHGQDGEADLPGPMRAACMGDMPFSM